LSDTELWLGSSHERFAPDEALPAPAATTVVYRAIIAFCRSRPADHVFRRPALRVITLPQSNPRAMF